MLRGFQSLSHESVHTGFVTSLVCPFMNSEAVYERIGSSNSQPGVVFHLYHKGFIKTFNRKASKFYWPGIQGDVT